MQENEKLLNEKLLSEQLFEFRAEQGKTQIEMAKLFGVTPSIYARWESGKVVPRRVNVYKIKKIIDGDK